MQSSRQTNIYIQKLKQDLKYCEEKNLSIIVYNIKALPKKAKKKVAGYFPSGLTMKFQKLPMKYRHWNIKIKYLKKKLKKKFLCFEST